ncbi:hypothetical protein GEV33_007063 [Tenebrio molitor]|uniref:RAD51D N-terminal domain-containing protein n=1 Tax=Tenebrio molitor TaxID=7067 RepID=A0A8J6HK06_TENMO|nr:hypothetical protein GEV33_007063 [Tenebrio molitor]
MATGSIVERPSSAVWIGEVLKRGNMNRLHSQIHPLLTEEVVGALHAKQVFTAADFIKAEAQQLVKTARLNFKEVLALKKFLTKNFAPTPVNGLNYYKSVLSNSAIIPTGINR